jgi:hypothetical protein
MRMLQHSSSMKKRFRQIVDVKFKTTMSFLFRVLSFSYWRRSSMLCEIRRFSSFSRWFKSCSQNLSKIFELVFLWRCEFHQCENLYFSRSTRSKMHSRSRKIHSIISMNENKENYSFEKKNYFFCLMIYFFKKKKSFFCFSSRHLVSIFRLSQKC